MKENEWLDKIRHSAQEVDVPESLTPNKIEELLKTQKRCRKKKRNGLITGAAAAAAVILLLGSYTAFQVMNGQGIPFAGQKNQMEAKSMDAYDGQSAAAEAQEDGLEAQAEARDEESAVEPDAGKIPGNEPNTEAEPRRDAGDLYVLAKDYQEVYDVLEQQIMYSKMRDEDLGIGMPEALEESMVNGAQKDSAVNNTIGGSAGTLISSQSQAKEQAGSNGISHSTTNLQTEGVDESDIIKTDGSYIYVVSGNRVMITDIRNGELKISGTIEIPADQASESVIEMYVDGDRLVLITEGQKTNMEQKKKSDSDYYYISSQNITSLYTYDITSRSTPRLMGKGTQEGNYNTSRKIGEMIYLFTQEMPEITYMDSSAREEDDWEWIPLVNDEMIAPGCIYIPKQGNSALIVASFHVDNPSQQTDNIMIVNDGSNVYVSRDAIYLYGEDYAANTTKIAKFTLGERLNAVGAASVKGSVTDTFAVNEYNGGLRILTTSTGSGKNSSSLYLLDEKLNVTGRLDGIAPGETIYSARFLGDIAYFVTYRNIDPLFAVDLSDVKNPKILGELKITGYSDYLHFWDEDKLLGLGYETDPDNGSVKGLKMAMFDISDPSQMKVIDSCVVENTSYSPALNQYKAALVDNKANLIGCAVSGYEKGNRKDNYLLFEWKDGGFRSLMTQPLSAELAASDYRGLYAGSVFYLVSAQGIRSFDRNVNYKLLKSLDFTNK